MKERILLILIGSVFLSGAYALAEDVTVSGVVKEGTGKKTIDNVSLTVNGTDIGTVSNAEGRFSLTFPDSLLSNGIRAEQIGYKGMVVKGKELLSGNIIIRLQPTSRVLDEITVYGADPRELIEVAIRKIPQNYANRPNMFSSFFRETIQKGKRYIGISEAIVDVYKRPYKSRSIAGDRVRMKKGRRLMSLDKKDTLAVKIMGGPTLPLMLDIVKNEDMLFGLSDLDNYEFRMDEPVMLDDRMQFVVSFYPKVRLDYPLHKGKLFIDQETVSFTRAEFSLDVSDKSKATQAMLRKKPKGLRFNPQGLDFVVSYRLKDGVSYLNYVSAKSRFKCDWKRRLFSSGYTAFAEMVMVDREENPSQTIAGKEAIGQRDIFYDIVDDFTDADFWKDYNIIEPTESLEKAVIKLQN